MSKAIAVRNLSKCFPANRGQAHALRAALQQAALMPLTGGMSRTTPVRELRWALNDITFEITRGESVALVGRNGAGKSVLLRLLSRVIRPTSGEADLYGNVGAMLDIGVGFDRELTGRENVFLQGAILGIRKRELGLKYDEIVAFSGIGDLMEQPLKSFSNGTQVRLAFAIAVQLEPEILLMDEVLAVADEEFVGSCVRKLTDLKAEGRTILLASHDMTLLSRLCSRALWFEQGKLVCDGPMAEVATRYHAHHHGGLPMPASG
jgi:lipopolysaccharide transport system ATP-binding protein